MLGSLNNQQQCMVVVAAAKSDAKLMVRLKNNNLVEFPFIATFNLKPSSIKQVGQSCCTTLLGSIANTKNQKLYICNW